MAIKENFFLIIIFLLSQYYMVYTYFKDTPYITDFQKIEDYEEAFKKNQLEYGFMLIYSKYCGHCKNFAPNYIKLSELFHNELFFYALSAQTNYRKLFKINGYPSILYYSNKTYNEITFSRMVSRISKFIRKYIRYNCTEITYNNIDVVYNDVYQKNDRNLVIGYFEQNSKFINSFISTTNNLKNEYIDLCYYCTNYKLMVNDKDDKYKKLSLFENIKENEVRTYSRNKGNNSFIFSDDNINNTNNYEKYLYNNVINLYEDIKGNVDVDILERMKNKEFVFFVYDNDNIKKKHIDIIYDLYNITTNKYDNLFYYILLYKSHQIQKFLIYQNDKIYLVSNNLSKITLINDINILKNRILENNLKSNIEIQNIITTDTIDNNDIIKDNNINININHNINVNSVSHISDIINQKDLTNKDSSSSNIEINNDNIKLNNEIYHNDNFNTNIADLADVPEQKDNVNIIITKGIKENINSNSNINSDKDKTKSVTKEKDEKNEKNIIIKNNHKNEKKNNTNNNTKNIIINKNDIKENSNKKKEIPSKRNNVLYVLITILIFIGILYIIITKYLCVGFIKVYDSQIIEFNQPNKIEIV